jgi:hypothetical protein
MVQAVPADLEVFSAITYNSWCLSPSLTVSLKGGVDIEAVKDEDKVTVPISIFRRLNAYQASEALTKAGMKEGKVSSNLAPIRFAYATKDSDVLNDISTHFEQREWGWLDSYEPEKQSIVIIVREGGGTSGYLIGANREAAQKTQHPEPWSERDDSSPFRQHPEQYRWARRDFEEDDRAFF